MNINATIRQIARQELTARQYEIWKMHDIYGMSFREIALRADLARTTITDHYDAACRTLRKYGVQVTPDGTHYQEPECPTQKLTPPKPHTQDSPSPATNATQQTSSSTQASDSPQPPEHGEASTSNAKTADTP